MVSLLLLHTFIHTECCAAHKIMMNYPHNMFRYYLINNYRRVKFNCSLFMWIKYRLKQNNCGLYKWLWLCECCTVQQANVCWATLSLSVNSPAMDVSFSVRVNVCLPVPVCAVQIKPVLYSPTAVSPCPRLILCLNQFHYFILPPICPSGLQSRTVVHPLRSLRISSRIWRILLLSN